MSSHFDAIVLGLLGSGFFTLIWNRLNHIEKDVDTITADLRQFYSITGELKGRMDTLEKRH